MSNRVRQTNHYGLFTQKWDNLFRVKIQDYKISLGCTSIPLDRWLFMSFQYESDCNNPVAQFPVGKTGKLHPIRQQSVESLYQSFRCYYETWWLIEMAWCLNVVELCNIEDALSQVSALFSVLLSFRSFVSFGQRNRSIGAAAKSQVK